MDSFQHEIPKSRVSITLDLHTGGARKKVELPLKLLVAGDYGAGKEQAPLAERKKINIDKNNFDARSVRSRTRTEGQYREHARRRRLRAALSAQLPVDERL